MITYIREDMKQLIKGTEKAGAIAVLISLADLQSENVINALIDHYVNGVSASAAAALNEVDKSNFNRACALLEAVAVKIDNYNLINGLSRHRDNSQKSA